LEKPVSCHLYPVRIKDFTEFAAVNYDKWDICDPACSLGQELEVPVYKFVKEALVRRFGEDWYLELEKSGPGHEKIIQKKYNFSSYFILNPYFSGDLMTLLKFKIVDY
jgi:hypothetical protein